MTYNGADLEARKNLAATIDTPVEVLRQLGEDPEAEVRHLVASNPNTPAEVIQKLGEEFPEAVTANPVFDLLALENPDNKFIKLSLARSSTTSEETLVRLVKTQIDEEEIICAVAKNISTPIHILEKLATWYPKECTDANSGSNVHACVATNPKTSSPLLKKLAEHEHSLVRQAVAGNTNTSLEVLEKLARDREQKVKLAVAKNINTSSSALEQLATEGYKDINNAILEHLNVSITALEIINFFQSKPGTPIYVLERLAHDSRGHVRLLVAEHPFTPPHALEVLARHSDIDNYYLIHKHVVRHPNCSSSVLEILTNNLADELKKIVKHRKLYGE